MGTDVPIGHWGLSGVTAQPLWSLYGSSTRPLLVPWPGCQVELTGSRDRWVLMEADGWEGGFGLHRAISSSSNCIKEA